MIGDLFAILGLTLFCALFWQQRRQSEIAKRVIQHKCEHLNLQLISVALKGHRFKLPDGQWRWHTRYQFEFSSLGDDCYQGELIMHGFAAGQCHIPPHRM